MVVKAIKRIVSKMVVQNKSGKRENGKSFWDNLYRKRSNKRGSCYHYRERSRFLVTVTGRAYSLCA